MATTSMYSLDQQGVRAGKYKNITSVQASVTFPNLQERVDSKDEGCQFSDIDAIVYSITTRPCIQER